MRCAEVLITHLETINRASTSSSVLTVTGLNFDAQDHTPSAYAVVAACGSTSWTSSTSIECELGSNNRGGGSTELWVQVNTITASSTFTFDGAAVDEVGMRVDMCADMRVDICVETCLDMFAIRPLQNSDSTVQLLTRYVY